MQSKTHIDRLGDKLRLGKIDAAVLTELESYRSSFGDAYSHVCTRLKALNYEVTGRPAKSTGAIIDKLKRLPSRLSQMQDIAGCRVVVDDIFFQRRALLAMETYLDDPQVFDRRLSPSHGYRAVHLIATVNGQKVEVQLRTRLQHLWAEISERFSDVVDPGLKYGVGDPEALRFLAVTSETIAGIEDAEGRRFQLMNVLNDGSVDHKVKKKIKKDIRTADRSFFSGRDRLQGFLENVKDEFDFKEVAV